MNVLYNKVKDIEDKYSTILDEQIFTLQPDNIVLEPPNQSKFSVKEMILKINVFCSCFLILIFLYINRVLREILLICKKRSSKIIYNYCKKITRNIGVNNFDNQRI